MERIFINVKITSSFDVPETGGNLVSGETIGQHFGKIAKHMEDGSIHHTVDNVLSNTSENPVQNKVVTTELNKKANKEIYTDSGISLGRDPDTDFGLHSIAIGDYCTATGRTSIAIGNQVVATADRAIAIGNFTTASAIKSTAIGDSTIAEGANSFAGGLESKTIGNNSFAFGSNVVTNKNNSAAFGTYNKSDENTLFSIGNGDSDTERSNAFEITKTGGKLHNKNIITIDDVATQSANGLMSAADKKKLDGMVSGNSNILVQGGICSAYSYDPSIYGGSDYGLVNFPKRFSRILSIVATCTNDKDSFAIIYSATESQAKILIRRPYSQGSTTGGSGTVYWIAIGEV